jgi:hypothetical protein
MQSQNQVVLAQPADSRSLSLALNNLTQTIFRSAEENINVALEGSGDAYTALERRAMIATEALRLTGGMDLAAIITRGDIIRQIETEGLAGVHPNGYADLTALAREQGISLSELSDTRGLCEVVFPYITDVLGQPLAEVWTTVGKSAMRELLPALRSLITGTDADHQSVRTAVETMLNNAAAALIADGVIVQGAMDEETVATVRRQAVESLLTAGATLPTRELRRTVRPTRTPPVDAATLQTGDNEWFAVIKITSREQYDLIMRQLGNHANNMLLDGRGSQTRDHVRTLRSFFGG